MSARVARALVLAALIALAPTQLARAQDPAATPAGSAPSGSTPEPQVSPPNSSVPPPTPDVAPASAQTTGSATSTIPVASAAPASSPPAAAAYSTAWNEAAFEAELARLVAAHPTRIRVAALGASKQGRRIALLSIGDLAGDPDQRPAALLATDLEARFGERPGGPEAALFAVRTLLERAEREPEVAELLAAVTLYAVPAPDPDGAFATGSARTCRLERNFPAGWQPSDAIDCPQGPYPCSEPETRELARLVAQRANVGALAVLARVGASNADPRAAEESPSARRDPALERIAAHALLDAGALARASDAVLAQPGSLAAFARARAGACVLALDPWSGSEGAAGVARAGFQALPAAVEALLRELPRLEAHSVRTERLRERLWLIEVELRVAGGLPTASAEERGKAPASVWLDVEGARISKIGARREGQPVANLDVARGKTWRIGHLQGNESVKLHLAVEGDEGGVVRLAFRSLRGGRAELEVALGG